MHISDAVFNDSFTISSEERLEYFLSIRAAASAYIPPDPIATIPSSGSITSPVPDTINNFSADAIASIASNFLKYLSVLQSFASSTTARLTLPENCSNFSSKRFKSVNASAVEPANPHTTLPLRRTLIFFELCFITVLPRDT